MENPNFKNPLVSVIVPTYNRAEILKKVIQSILSQDYSNLELIIVSDGSIDNTANVVQSFQDNRIKFFQNNNSGRPAVPRNFGIKQSKGDYIAFCDDDDLWLPEKLSTQIKMFQADPKLGLVFSACQVVDADFKQKLGLIPRKPKQGYIFKQYYLSSNFIPNSSVIITRKAQNHAGFLNEDIKLKAMEDFDYWLKVLDKYKAGYCPKPLVLYRISGDSIWRESYKILLRFYLYKSPLISWLLFIEKLIIFPFRGLKKLIKR